MGKSVIIAAALLSIAGAAQAADPLAPLDTPDTCWRCSHANPAPNAFGSVALRAGVTMYDARFRRVAATDAKSPVVRSAARDLNGLSPDEQLARVHQLVRARVAYMTDPESMRVADLWANAGETLASGHGDDEDIAIVKMQILKAAGFPADDLFLSVGRHKARGAHIVLLARTASGFTMLDHLHATPVRADVLTAEFKPVVTVGQGGSWVHGYRRPALASR